MALENYRTPDLSRPAAAPVPSSAEEAWKAQQLAAQPNTYANRTELERELAYNENELRILNAELAKLRAQYQDEDSLDRALAANRARRGDMANSRAHQMDIVNRRRDRDAVADRAMQWRWQENQNRLAREADQAAQAKNEIKRLKGEIDDLYIWMPADIEGKARVQAKIDRLTRELAAYGVNYDPTGTRGAPRPEGEWTEEDWEKFRIENTDTDKRGKEFWKSEEARTKYTGRNTRTAADAEKAKAGGKVKTAEELKAERDRYMEDARRADALVKKYLGKSKDLRFLARWNSPVPDDEIKLLKRFYTIGDGYFVRKK